MATKKNGIYKTILDVDSSKHQQTFEKEAPIYDYDKRKNVLHLSEETKNMQEFVQSFADSTLQQSLERFMPHLETQAGEHSQTMDRFDAYDNLIDKLEDYAVARNLPDELSVEELIQSYFAELQKQNGAEKAPAKESEKKGGENHETTQETSQTLQ